MKFTKEEAYEELVKRMTAKGEKLNLTERTLKRQLETLVKFVANDEMELDAFVNEVLPDVKELDGQYRKDNSDFVNEWKKNHPEPNQDDIKNNNNGGDKGDKKDDDQMAKMMAIIEKLQKESEDNKRNATLKNKRSELLEVMGKKGIKDKEWCDGLIDEITISEDMDVEAKADSLLKLYNKSKANTGGNTPPLGSSGGGTQNTASRFDYIKKDYEREHPKEDK